MNNIQLPIETAYIFSSHQKESDVLENCLKLFISLQNMSRIIYNIVFKSL